MGDPADDVRWQFRLFSWQKINLEGTGGKVAKAGVSL